MLDELLTVENVAVGVGGVLLLEGVEVALASGQIVGLSGPSGCGKSTLLRSIAGLIDQTVGRLLYQGAPVGAQGWPVYRRQVVLVSQQPALLDATVEENLARVFSYESSDETFPREDALALLERLGLGAERMHQPARSLSVGQQQRVCLIRALLIRPRVLLLDEPTSALDATATELVEDVLRESVSGGRCGAALVVAHDAEQLARLCDDSVDLSRNVVGAVGGSAA